MAELADRNRGVLGLLTGVWLHRERLRARILWKNTQLETPSYVKGFAAGAERDRSRKVRPPATAVILLGCFLPWQRGSALAWATVWKALTQYRFQELIQHPRAQVADFCRGSSPL